MRNPSLDQLADRDTAAAVYCPWCMAAPGAPCTTTDRTGTHPLENFPAHPARMCLAARETRA